MQGYPQWGSQEQLSYTASTQPKVTTTSNNLYHIEIGPSQNQINTWIEPEKPSVILSNWAWSSCGFGFLSHTIKAVINGTNPEHIIKALSPIQSLSVSIAPWKAHCYRLRQTRVTPSLWWFWYFQTKLLPTTIQCLTILRAGFLPNEDSCNEEARII